MVKPIGDDGPVRPGRGPRRPSAVRPLSRRRLLGGAAAAGLGAAAGVVGGWAAAPGSASAAQLTGASGRLVPVGDGREIWLESSGSGGPVLVLESGYHDGASIWSLEDLLPPAAGPLVFPGLAATNQVIAYHRPGTLDYTANPLAINTKSSPAPMPRTAADVVTDLHTALVNAKVPAPYVLVAHSLGGLFSRLYAQAHPGQVAGLVLVDTFSTRVPALMGAQWPAYRRLLNPSTCAANYETAYFLTGRFPPRAQSASRTSRRSRGPHRSGGPVGDGGSGTGEARTHDRRIISPARQ